MENRKLLTLLLVVGILSCNKKDDPKPESQDPQDYKITLSKLTDANPDWVLGIDAATADRAGVWIDLNNDGKKDSGEEITKFGEDELNTFPFSGSHTVTLYGKITVLICRENKLAALDVTKNPALEKLDCNWNYKLTAFDVSKNTKLKYLNMEYCYPVTALDVSKNTELIELNCALLQLTTLDVSKNTRLEYLNVGHNKLTVLDVSKNTQLKELYCDKMELTALDVSKNTKLKVLHCNNNQITAVDLSKNTDITIVHIYFNKIGTANMSQLITTLPSRSAADKAEILVLNQTHSGGSGFPVEYNAVPGETSINVAKSKNWKPYYMGVTSWREF